MKYLLTLALLALASPLYACGGYGVSNVVVGNAYAVAAAPVVAAQYTCPATLVAPQVAAVEAKPQVAVQAVAVQPVVSGYGYGAVSAFAVNHNVHHAVQAVVVRRRANVVVGHQAVQAVQVNHGSRAAVVVNGGGSRQRANVVVNQGGGRSNIAVNAPGVRVRVRGR